MARTSTTDPILLPIVDRGGRPGRLGLTFAPGKKQSNALSGAWDRDLALDVARLRQEHEVDLLVSLIEDHELRELQIEALEEVCADAGIEVVRFPIVDGDIPACVEATRALVERIRARLEAGDNVAIHCKGGLGRAGTLTSCVLRAEGRAPAEAIAAVRAVRPGAVDNGRQERFVEVFSRPGEGE